MLRIDQVNEVAERSRFTPAFMPPVGAQIGKHAGKITGRRNARSREGCSGVGVTPGVTAVGGLEDQVRVIVREATAAFVHTCNVHSPAAGHITRDLHVADEGTVVDHRYRRYATWRRYHWSRSS